VLLPPDAAEDRPPAAVATDCVGALGVFLAGPVPVFLPFLALLFYGDEPARGAAPCGRRARAPPPPARARRPGRGRLTPMLVLPVICLLPALVVTLAAALASLGRLAERRVTRLPVLSGWDVFGVTFFVVLYLAVVFGAIEVEGSGWLLAVGPVAAAVRVATLRAGARTGAGASR
jgi:hypothetical protein